MSDEMTHLDDDGHVRMVDVGGKPDTERVAVAEAVVHMASETAERFFGGHLPKGDAVATARIAGIMAAKRTPDLIPLCHPVALTGVSVDVDPHPDGVLLRATAKTTGPTGVEMEAMTAVSVAALAVYDMVKGIDRLAEVQAVRLMSKAGGKSGTWTR